MSKSLEKEYRKMASSDLPDLWNRISDALPEKKPVRRPSFKLAGPIAAAVCAAILIPALIGLGRKGNAGEAAYYTAEAITDGQEYRSSKSAQSAAAVTEDAAMEEAAMEEAPMEEAVTETAVEDAAEARAEAESMAATVYYDVHLDNPVPVEGEENWYTALVLEARDDALEAGSTILLYLDPAGDGAEEIRTGLAETEIKASLQEIKEDTGSLYYQILSCEKWEADE